MLAKVSVNEFNIQKTLKGGVFGRIPRKKPQLSKQNTTECLRFAKLHIDDPDATGGMWYDETEKDLFLYMRNVWKTIIIK